MICSLNVWSLEREVGRGGSVSNITRSVSGRLCPEWLLPVCTAPPLPSTLLQSAEGRLKFPGRGNVHADRFTTSQETKVVCRNNKSISRGRVTHWTVSISISICFHIYVR